MQTIEVGSEHPPSVAQALEKTIHDALQLARTEIALAKQEVTEQARSAGRAVVFLLVAVMFLQAAITTLGVLLLSLGGVALGFAVVGALVLIGISLRKSRDARHARRVEGGRVSAPH